jgi:hypothetical protein
MDRFGLIQIGRAIPFLDLVSQRTMRLRPHRSFRDNEAHQSGIAKKGPDSPTLSYFLRRKLKSV